MFFFCQFDKNIIVLFLLVEDDPQLPRQLSEIFLFQLAPCAFHFVKMFHFLEIQSTCCLYLQMTWIFSNELLHLDHRFSRKIFRPPWLENEISAQHNSQLLVITYYLQISRHGISWKLTLRIPLNKWGL